jgi:hypothetical protein
VTAVTSMLSRKWLLLSTLGNDYHECELQSNVLLLQVIQVRPPECWLAAFRALAEITCTVPEAMDASLEEDCLKLAVKFLKSEPNPAAEAPQLQSALTAVAAILARASSALGQTFIDLGGIPLLIDYLRLSPARGTALLTIIHIAMNPRMPDVGARLAGHVKPMDLPTLCEMYPPAQSHPTKLMDTLRRRFETAFGRPPRWQ